MTFADYVNTVALKGWDKCSFTWVFELLALYKITALTC